MSFTWAYNKQYEYLDCRVIGEMINDYQIGTKYPTGNEKNDGILYLHDKGIEIHGDCHFKISELNQKAESMYIHVRQHYLANEK
jgi:hypothetical protein